jgi:hypothetical protein
LHCFRRHHLAAGALELALSCGLDPVAQRLVAQAEFLDHKGDCLAVSHALDRQFLELGRACLFGYLLHFQLFQSNVILRHLWKTKFQGMLNAVGERFLLQPRRRNPRLSCIRADLTYLQPVGWLDGGYKGD